jgi:hypothetical protein
MAAVIREDLAVWKEAALLGHGVISELQKVAVPRWQKGLLRVVSRSAD